MPIRCALCEGILESESTEEGLTISPCKQCKKSITNHTEETNKMLDVLMGQMKLQPGLEAVIATSILAVIAILLAKVLDKLGEGG